MEEPKTSYSKSNTPQYRSAKTTDQSATTDPTIKIPDAEVIVVETTTINTTNRKGNKKYSKDLKNLQQAELKVSKASKKIANAVERGINSYLSKRKKSANKKKDGALEDFFLNFSKGVADFSESASPAIYDFGKAANTFGLNKQQKKFIKRQVRTIGRLIPPPFGLS